MSAEEPEFSPEETQAAEALRRVLRESAAASPLRLETSTLGNLERRRAGYSAPRLVSAAMGGLVVIVVVATLSAAFLAKQPGSSPGTASPVADTPSAAATLTPAGLKPKLGAFEPVLDVGEPLLTTGSGAMHESLGSASDGVVFIKDYGSAVDGADNVYHVTLYRSFDGVEWRQVSVPTPADQQDLQVGCRGWNCVVVSNQPQNGSILVTDDGNTWDSVSPSTKLFQTSIVAGPTGFVMWGWEVQTAEEHTVFSPDGREWQDISVQPGSQAWAAGSVFSDPTAGWLLVGAPMTTAESSAKLALSADGRQWTVVADPEELLSTPDQVGRTVFHFNGRWYLITKYRQMPAGYSPGGFMQPRSTSTPVASWQTLYWIDDGSSVLHSSGKLSTTLPDEVVAMDGYLVGAMANDNFTATLLTATDPLAWSDRGLLPPGVSEPEYCTGWPCTRCPSSAGRAPTSSWRATP